MYFLAYSDYSPYSDIYNSIAGSTGMLFIPILIPIELLMAASEV